MRTSLTLVALLALMTPTVARATAPPEGTTSRRLSLEEAETLALQSNPSLAIVTARAKAGELGAKSIIGRMLPSVALSEEYQHWNSPFEINFAPGTKFTARDQDTNVFAVAANQPLLGLGRLISEYQAQKSSASATTAQYKVSEDAVRKAVRVAFIRHFEARALEDIARQSEKELSEQVAIAQAKLKAGVLTNADVLRVQVAGANATQQEIVARTQADVARANILIAAGMSPDDSIELVEPSALLRAARSEPPAYAAAIQQALSDRPELATARLLVEHSEHAQRARLLALLPDINLAAGYTRVDGQVFAPANAAFVGIKANWLIWDFGATWFGYQAARAATAAAIEESKAQRRQIAGEVASELALSRSARSAVRLAEQSIESAAEAYRVTDALVKAGAATTTDLLESQSALSQARLNLVRAQYQLALAHVAVEHATGRH